MAGGRFHPTQVCAIAFLLIAAEGNAQDAPAVSAASPPTRSSPQAPPRASTASETPSVQPGAPLVSSILQPIIQGDRAMLVGDRELARSWYQRAIKQNPQVAAAHLRMAQVHLAAGELSEADAVLRTALVFAGTDLRLKARLYFLQAVVRERTTEPSAALASWNAFLSFAQTSVGEPQPLPTGGQGHEGSATPAVSDVSPGVSNVEHPPIRSGEAPLYRGTVVERKRMIAARAEVVAAANAVRERAEKVEQQARIQGPVQ